MNIPQQAASTGAPQASHLDLAMQQLAMHAVKLAVARWRIGYTSQETPPSSTQARWLARTQDHFVAWLEAGGFSQQEPEPVFSDTDLLAGSDAADADASHTAHAAHAGHAAHAAHAGDPGSPVPPPHHTGVSACTNGSTCAV